MYIMLFLPIALINLAFAIVPERCKAQTSLVQDNKNPKQKNTKKAIEPQEIAFDNKKLLAKQLASHRAAMYKGLIKNGITKENAKKVYKLNFLEKPVSSAKSQPEFVMTIDLYTSKFLKHEFVAKAFFHEHLDVLNDAQTQYGVDKEIIVALITMESLAGYRKGDINILETLFTLAYTSKRREFFTKELLAAFKLMQSPEYHFHLDTKGSWAGAMGYSQFMPSSVLNYAVDGDKNGVIDIINSPIDAIYSAANYLNKAGWKYGEPVVIELTTEELQHIDVCAAIDKPYEGGKFVLQETNPNERFFVVYNNYNAIIRWNRSFLFAYTANKIASTLKVK
jgi:membrane-bound lytic murein transglycosylase B